MYQVLGGDLAQAGPSTQRTTAPKIKRVPPIVAKLPNIRTSDIEQIKAQCKNVVNFEYARNGLRIKTTTAADHLKISQMLRNAGVEFYTYHPNLGQNIKYVMRGLPPSTTCEEVSMGLSQQGVVVSHVRQVKRSVTDETNQKVTKLLPLLVVSIIKAEQNIQNLKKVVGINHFSIRFEDFKASNRLMQCFKCQSFGHKAEFWNLKQKCVKCAGLHNTRECTKPIEQHPKCVNCNGEHPANYRGCPTAQKFKGKARGVTRTPGQAQRQTQPPAPRISSRRELPSLPQRPSVVQESPSAPISESAGDPKDLIQMVTSGSLTKYIKKFKALMTEVMRQPDKAGKLLTLGLGIAALLDDGQED